MQALRCALSFQCLGPLTWRRGRCLSEPVVGISVHVVKTWLCESPKPSLLWLVLQRLQVTAAWWEGLCTKKSVVQENKLASEVKVLLKLGQISEVYVLRGQGFCVFCVAFLSIGSVSVYVSQGSMAGGNSSSHVLNCS